MQEDVDDSTENDLNVVVWLLSELPVEVPNETQVRVDDTTRSLRFAAICKDGMIPFIVVTIYQSTTLLILEEITFNY